MYEGMLAETVRIQGHNGGVIDAYLARPLGAGPCAGVVLLHPAPGWDESSREMTRKLAYHGYATISPDLHYRERPSPTTSHADVSAIVREAGGVPDDWCLGDVEGAISYLRSLPYLNGKVGIIGFCSGGRQVYMVACKIPSLDAAVDCWGGGVVVASPDELTPRQPVAALDMTANLACPLLGLFGNDDNRPSPADVARTEEELKRHGKTYEFHQYDNAGHGFFNAHRPGYRQHAAVDGWEKVFAWFEKYLSTSVAEQLTTAARR